MDFFLFATVLFTYARVCAHLLPGRARQKNGNGCVKRKKKNDKKEKIGEEFERKCWLNAGRKVLKTKENGV